MVPASVVRNVIISGLEPEVVRDGATPDGHLTEECHVVVCPPPFVIISVTVPAVSLVGGLLKLNSQLPATVTV